MGQKVNANGLRIGINRGWEANWFASKKDFAKFLGEDIAIREYLEPKLVKAVVSHIDIAREKTDSDSKVTVTCFVLNPGIVLADSGKQVAALEKDLRKKVASGKLKIRIEGVKEPDLDATLVAKSIAQALENRESFRSSQKKAIQRMRKAGAQGCRTQCQGRLGGAEIARREGYKVGNVPLETLRADIEYASVAAATAYGNIGVKVWICRNKDESAKKPLNIGDKKEGGNE